MGKSHCIRKLQAFLFIFAAKHIDIKEEQFSLIFLSPKKELALDQASKTMLGVDKALELFNKKYPTTQLTQNDKYWNATTKRLNITIRGKTIPYSGFDVLWATAAVNAGYTANVIFVDEAQECNVDHFNQQIKPFRTRTGGPVLALGTTLPDVSNVLFDMFNDQNMPTRKKFIVDCEKVVKYKRLISEEAADKYWHSVQKEIEKYGRTSEYVQTQYYCSFNVTGDRFITREKLINSNVCKAIGGVHTINHDSQYVVVGWDPAIVNDYSAVSVATSNIDSESIVFSELKECFILNKDKEVINIENQVAIIAELCKKLGADYVIVDSTAAQNDRAYYLYRKLKLINCNTQVVPLNYGNNNKEKMFTYLQDAIFKQQVRFPTIDYCKSSAGYTEFIDELLYFKKELLPSGRMKFSAPVGSNFYDDVVCSAAQALYALHYILRLEYSKRLVTFGGSEQYYLSIKKNWDKSWIGSQRVAYHGA